jgi:hypothetical protein
MQKKRRNGRAILKLCWRFWGTPSTASSGSDWKPDQAPAHLIVPHDRACNVLRQLSDSAQSLGRLACDAILL